MMRQLFIGVVQLAPVAHALAAHASEIVVQNDATPPGTPVLGPMSGYRIGVQLEMPVDGTLAGVQIGWGSQAGGAAPSQEAAIRISNLFTEQGQQVHGYDLQGPGDLLATISSPVLVDGALNEFRHLDPSNQTPLAVPVEADKWYFVDLEFLSDTDPGGVDTSHFPSVLMDSFSDVPLQNSVYYPNITIWIPVFLLGGGDFAIRAIVVPVPEPSSTALALAGAAEILALLARRAKRGRGT